MKKDGHYDLESVNLPRLSGLMLRLFTRFLENPITRPLLIGTFLKSAGIGKLRGMTFDEPPTLFPLLPSPGKAPGLAPDLSYISDDNASETRNGFAFPTVRDYATAFRNGGTTPLEVAERIVSSIADGDRRDPPLRYFISSNSQDVLRQASEATARIRAGKSLSILDGVPVAVKDEIDVMPYGTTAGTSFLGTTGAREDSTVASRLRATGAILVGKTNMHEIGISTTGLNPHHGTPGNPYGVDRYTGGSSGGSAAVVASGLCPLAIGADGGGSIRIPASYCGVIGLKPTYGRVSEYGAVPLDWSVAHIGPLAATVHDAALGYAAMAGPDPCDPNSLSQPQVTIDGWDRSDLTGLSLGVYRPWFEHATKDVVGVCTTALDRLRERGAVVKEITIGDLDAVRIAHSVTILCEMASGLERYHAEFGRKYDRNTRILLTIARELTARGRHRQADGDGVRPQWTAPACRDGVREPGPRPSHRSPRRGARVGS